MRQHELAGLPHERKGILVWFDFPSLCCQHPLFVVSLRFRVVSLDCFLKRLRYWTVRFCLQLPGSLAGSSGHPASSGWTPSALTRSSEVQFAFFKRPLEPIPGVTRTGHSSCRVYHLRDPWNQFLGSAYTVCVALSCSQSSRRHCCLSSLRCYQLLHSFD